LSLNVSIKCKKSQAFEDDILFVKLSSFIPKKITTFEVSEVTQTAVRTAETLVSREVDVSEFNQSFITNNVDVKSHSDKYFSFLLIL
jgi:hypothetical protein